MLSKLKVLAVAAVLAGASTSALGQYISVGYKFIEAVKARDGAKVTEQLQSDRAAVINFRNDAGDGALHVLAGRRDLDWLDFMIAQGANPNIQDGDGDTPLLIAARSGWLEGVNTLLRSRARVDLANRMGETPLIVAVQQRQSAVVKRLLEAGANPNKPDNATGRSARDYAKQDTRSAEMLRLIDTAKPVKTAPVAGPKL
jgi:ankyrin repeat protein